MAGAIDLPVMGTDPGADFHAAVPAGVIPDQEHGPLAFLGQAGEAPGEKLGRDGADGAPVNEAQLALLEVDLQQPAARQGFGIRVIGRDRRLDRPQGLVRRAPGGQRWLGKLIPSDRVETAENVLGVERGPAHQTVAGPFCRAYAGSGRVIQRVRGLPPAHPKAL